MTEPVRTNPSHPTQSLDIHEDEWDGALDPNGNFLQDKCLNQHNVELYK